MSGARAPNDRVCPDCGVPAASGSFCEQCGLNLATVDRLPTREQWELARDNDVQAIAKRVATITDLTPGLFDLPVPERRLDNAAAVQTIERALCRAIESAIPRAQRTETFAVHARGVQTDIGVAKVTARVAVRPQERVDQDFDCVLQPGAPRARVAPAGPPRFVREAVREPGSDEAPQDMPGARAETGLVDQSAGRAVPIAIPATQMAQPAGWYANPATGLLQWWDGHDWGSVHPGSQRALPEAGTNGLAIASLVLGIVWLYWIGSVLAIVLGLIAERQCDERGQAGKGMATAGVILGVVGVAVFVILLIFVKSVTP